MTTATLYDNLAVLANAVNIATDIISDVSGDLVSNHLDGVPLNDKTVAAVVAADIHSAIEGRDNA